MNKYDNIVINKQELYTTILLDEIADKKVLYLFIVLAKSKYNGKDYLVSRNDFSEIIELIDFQLTEKILTDKVNMLVKSGFLENVDEDTLRVLAVEDGDECFVIRTVYPPIRYFNRVFGYPVGDSKLFECSCGKLYEKKKSDLCPDCYKQMRRDKNAESMRNKRKTIANKI